MQESLRRDTGQSRSSTESWFERRRQSAMTDSRGCSRPNGLVPGSFQHPGGSRSLQNDATQWGATSEHIGKPARQKSEPHNKGRINRRSSDATRGGYKGARPAPKSEERLKPEIPKSCTFEVNLSDFPELCDIKPLTSPDVRSCWGSVRSPALHDSPAATVKEPSGNKGPKQKSTQHITSTETEKTRQKSTATAGWDPELVLPNPYGSSTTSWARIASQPPKIMQQCPAARDVSSREDVCQPESEQSAKKKGKKKKKSKPVYEDVEQEMLIQQEPPKFEDEEEFPDLSLASVNPSKGPRTLANPRMQENTGILEKDGSALQSDIINKGKASDGKSSSAASKKAQPAGQKKSKAPVQLDLGNMLSVLEQKQHSQKSRQDVKPIILSVGGALPVVHKDQTAQKKHSWQKERIAHNPLDSTCPLVKKGKQREVPKAKKPTPLKRVILKEREERKQNRLLEERDPTRMPSEVSEEPQASEDLSESSCIMQQGHEPTGDQSSAEEADGTGSPEDLKNPAEENALSKNPDSNSSPNRLKIHSRKFRDYCSQMLSKDVDECVTTLLKELARFQDRLYQKDPMKARMKRRLVMGLREVLKHLKLRKIKCVIISPNCERVQSKGGLDEALHTIIDTCREQGVPFVFALSRKALGRCVNKVVPVSLVGIFNYDGAQDHYHKMIELTSQARKAYEVMVANLEVSSQEQPGEENETQTLMEPPMDTPEAEEPEYIKVWKKMLENDYIQKFLSFEEQFTSETISTDSDNHQNDLGGS